MSTPTYEVLSKDLWPKLLHEMPDKDKPAQLYLRGQLPYKENKILAVVGSRHYSSYGKEACETLIAGLCGFPITIVSGLALGIDCIAHKAALKAGLQTCAIPGSGIDSSVLYPAHNRQLADDIITHGGGILSEFDPFHKARPENFPQRNRIMAGMSHAAFIIEARIPSGTLITSRLATEYNRDVLTLPGSIFSKTYEGPHMLLRLGATPIRTSNDILEALGFALQKNILPREHAYIDCSKEEKEILCLLEEPQTKTSLIGKTRYRAHELNILISTLELRGYIKEKNGVIYCI